jgi:hypothetical protein
LVMVEKSPRGTTLRSGHYNIALRPAKQQTERFYRPD